MINKIIGPINKIINGFDPKLQGTIKNSFILVIIVLMVVGGFIGYRKGKGAAVVKSEPLAETTNEVFKLDIAREKNEGAFSSMLDSELINESKNIEIKKIEFPSRENLKPDMGDGIIESKTDRKMKASSDMEMDDPLIEGNYRPVNKKESDVRSLKRKVDTTRGNKGRIYRSENTGDEPLRNLRPVVDEKEDAKMKSNDKAPIRRLRRKESDLLKNNTGIIEN